MLDFWGERDAIYLRYLLCAETVQIIVSVIGASPLVMRRDFSTSRNPLLRPTIRYSPGASARVVDVAFAGTLTSSMLTQVCPSEIRVTFTVD
jgi:hypothetical protein